MVPLLGKWPKADLKQDTTISWGFQKGSPVVARPKSRSFKS